VEGQVTARRVAVDGARDYAVVADDGGELVLEDVALVDTRPRELDQSYGGGMDVQRGAQLMADRLLLSGNLDIGIYVSGGERPHVIRDLSILDTQSAISNQAGGRGLNVEGGGRVELARACISRNREVAIAALDPQSAIIGSDVRVADTDYAACRESGCVHFEGGVGAATVYGGQVELTRFQIARSALVGLQLSEDGTMDLHDGEVSGSIIGANIQYDGFDIARISDRVVYVDNEVNLDSRELPIPDPADVPSFGP
jgi:hypothetical protein